MTTDRLLPCPFCGNEAEMEETLSGTWAIYCAHPIRMGGCFGRMDGYIEKSDAIAAWNKRSPSDEAVAVEKVVEAAIQFEREHNMPLENKDLALAALRRKELYAAVARLAALRKSQEGRR